MMHVSTTSAPIYPLLEKLGNVKQTGENQWMACCPSEGHDDQKQSLAVSIGATGKLLLKCHAGCELPQILRAIPAEYGELFPRVDPSSLPGAVSGSTSPSDSAKPRIVAAYDYPDESKTLLYQSVRMVPKDFRQRRPDSKGGWKWSMGNVRKVPYRLPDLLAADPAEIRIIVEGEKDADRLGASGFVSTTNVGGAGKWQQEYNDHFRDRHVVILPDNDDPGRKHAEQVARSLNGIAKSIKVVALPGLPPKGDVSDFIDGGGTRAQFLEAIAAAPLWQQTEAGTAGEAGAGKDRKPSAAEGITNYVELPPDDPSKPPVKMALSMPAILQHLFAKTDGWPKRVGGCLFIRDNSKPEVPNIAWLEKPQSLFGWLGSVTNIVPRISGGTGFHSSSEIYSEVARTAENFAAVEIIPHHPPIEGHFYCCETPQPGDGSTLSTLLDRFNPASPIDRDLIMAFLATLLWGGPGGCRPVFVVSSPDGRGAGKTRLVSMAAHLVGGQIELSPTEDIAALKTRLLSPDALRKRLATIDNVKSFKFSWGDLEALVTSPTITGKRMYVGEAERPGTMTYAITLNGPALSKDMAQRSVVIELARPIYSGTWEEETRAFIDANRQQLIGDLIGFLQSPQQMPRRFSRWGQWEREVLSRLPDPHEAQVVILDRQETTDADAEESAILEDHFRICLEQLGYIPGRHAVMIPSRFACKWFQEATGEKGSTQGISRRLIQAIDEGTIQRLRRNACKTWGRGFIWEGEDHDHNPADQDTHIKTDLDQRIAEMLARQA